MADDVLFSIVYPNSAPGLPRQVDADSKTIRAVVNEVDQLRARLTLAAPDKGDLAGLAQEASPLRFERTDLAARFVRESPRHGDAKFWQEAGDKDAALGGVRVALGPFMEAVEQALAVTLAKLSERTGSIERTVDVLKQDPANATEVSPFLVADEERLRIDETVAGSRARAQDHRTRGDEEAARSDAQAQREVGARDLLEADPQRLLQTKATFKLKGDSSDD